MNKITGILLLCVIIAFTLFLINPISAQTDEGKLYKIYQFPDNKLPVLDGDLSDWSMIPDSYIIDASHIRDERLADESKQIPDPKDLDVQVIVAWHNKTNRIYFMVKKYDDFNNFNRPNLAQIQGDDIFEIVIDADNSESSCFTDPRKWKPGQEKLQSVFEQNYHTFMPPREGNIITWIWGIPRWLERKEFQDGFCKFEGKHGDSGWSYLEWYITPYDYASHLGPDYSAVHDLEEGDIIGLSWSFIDWDENEKRNDGFYNLAHDFRMIRDGKFLPKFRLEAIENMPSGFPKADFSFTTLRDEGDGERSRIVKFESKSEGEITEYFWEFGDGETSTRQNPRHDYRAMTHEPVTLTVKGPLGEHKKMKMVRTY